MMKMPRMSQMRLSVAFRRQLPPEVSQQAFSSSSNRGPPITYDYMPIPKKPYLAERRALNRKFNRYLVISFLCLGVSLYFAYRYDTFELNTILANPESYRKRHDKKGPVTEEKDKKGPVTEEEEDKKSPDTEEEEG